MEIFKIPFYAWRYSLRELHEYPFFEYSDSNLLREYTRENLNNSIISNWISKLLNRDPDYYKNLLLQSETSNVRRQLDYATKILISSVIKTTLDCEVRFHRFLIK
ncbi:MAG: hypothetical protein IJ220_03020 [Clostridia bacterium]|nr:hypothetical protein [Clostridia bacterium]